MEVVRTVAAMRKRRRQLGGSVGLVPTMGFLHAGHLSLARQARADNEHVVASIFVNPAQFGPHEDFQSYPRDEGRDLELLAGEGTEIVFAPDVAEVYPPGFSTYVQVEGITERLEGAARPGHFRGVATVVAKLFLMVAPTRAYFGQKDAQQLLVVRKMVADLNLDLEVVGMPTVREPDGLALSSRNAYLDAEERRAALVLRRSLDLAEGAYAKGERVAEPIRAAMRELIAAEPRAGIDYVSIADASTLDELERIDRPALVSLAVRVGRTRLIDNTVITGE